MFIGREKELKLLENMYNSKGFQFLVMYGRRRVGKTLLLQEFSKSYKVIFFSAQEKTMRLIFRIFQKPFSRLLTAAFSEHLPIGKVRSDI